MGRLLRRSCLLLLLIPPFCESLSAGEFETFLKPLLARNCQSCHSGDDASGGVNFQEITSAQRLLDRPKVLQEMIGVIDANDMPPESEPELPRDVRDKLLVNLKSMLREASLSAPVARNRVHRLNRFQYNNAVKDLFRLNRDVFALPEKLMTRHANYVRSGAERVPDKVEVASHALNPPAGLREVKAFPKDLRASHGFDNQANQLTLSPLLLDTFLRLSVSILESPDFNKDSVGLWNDFFAEPETNADLPSEIRNRLRPFLRQAFRGPVDDETLDRYTAYAVAKIDAGTSFTDSMKKVASAALSSPLFLYRTASEDGHDAQFVLASDLSFFLWSSGPDLELLRLAEQGELSQPEQLEKTLERMLADPKIERFLDTFPGQWLQLENILAATPDPQKQRYFSLDKQNPASLQMLLEPLLLFDAVFIEDRPVIELIRPQFGYRSEFLQTWYASDLKPPPVDVQQVIEQNRRDAEQRKQLETSLRETEKELNALVQPVRKRLLEFRQQELGNREPVDLKPYAAWEFDNDLQDAVGTLHLKPHGKIEFQDGFVVLNRSYLLSEKLPKDLKTKSLEVWFKLDDVKQTGGGLMGIQGPGDFFDTIVLGERKVQHWISGSNGFSRTEDFPESTPETDVKQRLHLAMVYTSDGTITLYRNGKPYGKPYRKGPATFPKGKSAVIFGLRHLPAGGNKYLNVRVDKARLYDRALTAEEVAASSEGENLYITDKQLRLALNSQQQQRQDVLQKTIDQTKAALAGIPAPRDPEKLRQNAQKRYDDEIRRQLRQRQFRRIQTTDARYGGVITNAAMFSMTSGPTRTHPIARGAWIIEVILNDPPPPPPNDVPPLNEEEGDRNLTIP